jgi:thioredoxin 1
MSVKHIHSPAEWRQAVSDPDTDKICVFDFYGEWCGPCKIIAPAYEAMADECKNIARFYKVDSDEMHDLAEQQLVSALPTFVFFHRGKRIGHYVGANIKGFREKLDNLLAE